MKSYTEKRHKINYEHKFGSCFQLNQSIQMTQVNTDHTKTQLQMKNNSLLDVLHLTYYQKVLIC